MPIKFYNVRELISPEKFKLKILVYGLAGVGKTRFMSTAESPEHPLFAGVCETGHGKGQMTVAIAGHQVTDLISYGDFEEFCAGVGQEKAGVSGLDSLSDASKTFIKDKALSIPRAKGESLKRALGVPELDDYGTMGELTRKHIRKLLDHPRHVIATAGLRIDKPDAENGQGEMLIGPDLPGQMFLGSTAMFDLVLCLRTRSLLRDPKDAKSRYTQRYFLTENQGQIIAKNRLNVDPKGLSFLPTEVSFDPATGSGTFDWFLNEAKKAYTKYLQEHPEIKVV